MKKSCNNCKAYEFHHECSLGYETNRGKPKEDCPKPLSTKALVLAMQTGRIVKENTQNDKLPTL